MFDVLMFLFENYMDGSITLKAEKATILAELEKVGFERHEIDRALNWLDGLNHVTKDAETESQPTVTAMRHYLPEECEQLGVDGRGFLLYLEQLGILDPHNREIVIDRVMALDSREVDLGRIKWVVLMVLFSQPDKKSALSLLQEIVLADDVPDVLH